MSSINKCVLSAPTDMPNPIEPILKAEGADHSGHSEPTLLHVSFLKRYKQQPALILKKGGGGVLLPDDKRAMTSPWPPSPDKMAPILVNVTTATPLAYLTM